MKWYDWVGQWNILIRSYQNYLIYQNFKTDMAIKHKAIRCRDLKYNLF